MLLHDMLCTVSGFDYCTFKIHFYNCTYNFTKVWALDCILWSKSTSHSKSQATILITDTTHLTSNTAYCTKSFSFWHKQNLLSVTNTWTLRCCCCDSPSRLSYNPEHCVWPSYLKRWGYLTGAALWTLHSLRWH